MARFTMVEFSSPDAKSSATFFANVFDFPHLEYGPEYMDVQLGNDQTLGFHTNGEAAGSPLAVIEVDDLEATKRKVVEAGGTITVDNIDFPGGRRFHFTEPGGNQLAAWVRVEESA